MKKLLSVICCVLYLDSISHAPIEAGLKAEKASGEKVLIKAIAVFMNPEGNKKMPAKRINLSSTEGPWA
jgi:hypothetical protein